MDTTIFLTIIILLVGIVLIAVGIYLIVVLNEIRNSARRFNSTLNHLNSIFEVIDTKIAKPAGSLVGVLSVVKEIVDILQNFRGRKKEGENGEPQPQ